MLEEPISGVNSAQIQKRLESRGKKMKLSLKACAHCTLCAESCFLFMANGKDPTYTPSYKFIHSIGRLYKKKGRVNRAELEEVGRLVWHRCVLCTRCYCPIGIDIPDLLSFARSICREQGVYPDFGKE